VPEVVFGAVHPAGNVSASVPACMPPVAAVYVKVSVFDVVPAVTLVGETVSVPEPFAASAFLYVATALAQSRDVIVAGAV
jgi:hypothetical protein